MEKNDKTKKIKEEQKDDESPLFSTSLVFDQNINKIWFFIRDLKNETKTIDYLDNLQYIKGNNTWMKGNTFSVNWIGLTSLKFKCLFLKEGRNKKIIKWKGEGGIGLKYYRALYLYRITQNNKTMVKVVVTIPDNNNDYIDYKSSKSYFSNLEYNILLEKSKFLNSLKEDVISYESCIIHQNFEIIWKILIDLKKSSKTIFKCHNLEFNDSEIKEGLFLKFNLDCLKMQIFVKITQITINKNRKRGSIKLEVIGVKYNKILKKIECKIIKINDNKTQFSILHIFPPDINQDFINQFQTYKKEEIKKYKKFFEEENL
jgi:hypothetical protein